MSGIAGIFHIGTGQPVEAVELDGMLEQLANRGPDGADAWLSGPVGLGHRHFNTTPQETRTLSKGQPLVYRQGELAITADARIDNRTELIQQLGLKETADRPEDIYTDAELILMAYERWEVSCPEKLVGDFAFAIWDGRAQKFFCARDPMGIKPLYYYHSPRLFVFASEIQPLFCLPETPCRLNDLRIADHLALNAEDRHSTFYEEIYALPSAQFLVVDKDGIQLQTYWDLDAGQDLRLSSDQEYTEAFLEIFIEAVRCRLRSERSHSPAGALLSGGLDSSAIVAVARRWPVEGGAGLLPTFSAVFPDLAPTYPRIDERPWIEAVVAQGGLQSNYIPADRIDPLEALFVSADEPLPVPNLWLNWGCFRAAQEQGVRILLSGVDGDTAVSYGHGYLAELAVQLHWKTLLNEARSLARQKRWTLRRVIRDYGLSYLLPPAFWRIWRWLHRQSPRPSPLPFDIPINPEFAHRVRLVERAWSYQEDLWKPLNPARELHRAALRCGTVLYMPELVDKIGASLQVEPRLPFFDRRLLEFLVSLPTRQKLRGGWNRFILRQAMEGLLPKEVQWRTDKGDLRPNIRRGLLSHRQLLEDTLGQDGRVIAEYMDLPKLRTGLGRFLSAPMESTEQDVFSLVIAITLSHWLQGKHAKAGIAA